MKKFIFIQIFLFGISNNGRSINAMILIGGGTKIKYPNSSLHFHLFLYPIKIALCLESASVVTLLNASVINAMSKFIKTMFEMNTNIESIITPI